MPTVADDENWRLKAAPAQASGGGSLEHLVGATRDRELARELGGEVPHDVVITHDGSSLYAYAASEQALASARVAVEAALARAGVDARVVVSHWDGNLDEWLQVDPPLAGADRQREEAAERDAETVETRALVASAGKMVRAEVEQSMRRWAQQLDLELAITEHRHLLTCQVSFEVTGARRKIDEFAAGLRAEEHATMRTELAVMSSPL